MEMSEVASYKESEMMKAVKIASIISLQLV